MNRNSKFGLLVVVALILSGCTSYERYHTQINNYEVTKFSTIKKRMKIDQVHQQLGTPVFHAQLTEHKLIERYYSEKLKYETESGEYDWSYLTLRDTNVLDIWYKNGKVDKTQAFVQSREYIPLSKKENTYNYQTSDSFSQERRVNSHYLVSYPLIGVSYDVKQALRVKKGDSISRLMWRLGVPNRVIPSKSGEKFIYEYGDFIDEVAPNSFKAYRYAKSVFTLFEGEVVEVDLFNTEIDLSAVVNTKWSDSDFLKLFFFVFQWHAQGVDIYEQCLEEKAVNVCKIADYLAMTDKDWVYYPEVPELITLSYYLMDMDLGNIKEEMNAFYNDLLAFSNNETGDKDKQIELFYILRSSVRSGLIVGEDSFESVFASETHHPLKSELNTENGRLAKTWLNLLQPNKWYFSKSGQLNAKLSFSPLFPMSPWYLFGPPARHNRFFVLDDGIDSCSRTARNCTKKLSKIYSDNLTYPQL